MSLEFQDMAEGRYDRHALIGWWEQKRLAQARVIVAGAGALGNEVLKLLTLVGVGHITVVDYDRVARSNLARMVLFREPDVGRLKVEAAVERLREINPEVEVHGIEGDLRFEVGLGDYRAADIVFGCLDSVNARWALNRKCMLAGVDWIDGGISDHHGLVAHYSPGGGACYECNFTPATLERFNRRYSCPYGLASSQPEELTPTTAVTTSLIAAVQVQQALLSLHGIEAERLPPGERLLVYLKPFRMLQDRLPQNLECLAHQTLPEDLAVLEGSNELTVEKALRWAEKETNEAVELALPYDLVTRFFCPTCETETAVNRPKEKVFQEEGYCPDCGGLRQVELVSSIGRGSPLSRLRLREIGIPKREILSFTAANQIVYFLLSD